MDGLVSALDFENFTQQRIIVIVFEKIKHNNKKRITVPKMGWFIKNVIEFYWQSLVLPVHASTTYLIIVPPYTASFRANVTMMHCLMFADN